jgi:hypothetical protein
MQATKCVHNYFLDSFMVTYGMDSPQRAANGKTFYTDEIADKIVDAVRSGLTVDKAAELVGLEPKTVQNWCGKRRTFGERVKKARREHEVSLLRSIELAGEKSWQARAWLAERIHGYAVPSARLQVSGSVEHGMSNNLAQLLAGVASQRREKKAQVIEAQEVKALEEPKSKYNSYCATDDIQPIVTPTLSNPGDALPLERKAKHKAMRRRKPRAESLAKYPPATTPPTGQPPASF